MIDHVAPAPRRAPFKPNKLGDQPRIIQKPDSPGIQQRQKIRVDHGLWVRALIDGDPSAKNLSSTQLTPQRSGTTFRNHSTLPLPTRERASGLRRAGRWIPKDGPRTVITKSSRLIPKGEQPLIAHEPQIRKQRRRSEKNGG